MSHIYDFKFPDSYILKSKNKCKTNFNTIFYLTLNPKGSLSDFFFFFALSLSNLGYIHM